MAFVSMSEVKVGTLVVLAVALVLALTLSVGNFREYFTNTIRINITIPSVVGLDNFSPVTYSGVRIGTVVNIRFDEERDKAIVEAKINLDSPVSLDSKAQFTSASLLSPLFVEISEGSKDKRLRDLIRKGEIDRDKIYLEAKPYLSIGDLFNLAGDVKIVLKQVEELLNGVKDLPNDLAGFIASVSQDTAVLMEEVNGMLVDGRPRIMKAIDRMDGIIQSASDEVMPTLKNIRKGSNQIPGFISNAQTNLERVIGKAGGLIDTVSPEVKALSGEAIQLIQDLQKRVEILQSSVANLLGDVDSLVVDNREDVKRLIAHLERTAANLNEISAELKKNPWRILWKTEEKLPPGRVSPVWEPILETGK